VLTVSALAEGVVFRPGDVLEMRVTGVPAEDAAEFAQTYAINEAGNIPVPLVGDVKAAGRTVGALQAVVRAQLIAGKIFTNPTIAIVVPAQQRLVTVGGGVKNPQRLGWTHDLTLTAAINAAGGFDDFSGRKVRLIRAGKAEVFDARKLAAQPAADPQLRPGDQIVVQ
jgi:protein involved in polysaccharide export with SLBB domain